MPGARVKNGEERLIVLNRIARSVIEARRGAHETHVFACRGRPVARMLNSAWLRARLQTGLPQVRVHDLKHTFGLCSGRITTHYSAAELTRLIGAAESVCDQAGKRPELVVLRRLSVS